MISKSDLERLYKWSQKTIFPFKKENITIYKQEYLHPEYNHKIFIPNLSILDLLFYNFNTALKIIRAGRNWKKLN